MDQAEPQGEVARRVEGNVEAQHHARAYIDEQGEPRTANGLAIDVVHQYEVDRGVIDLYHRQRHLGAREMAT